MSIPPNIRVFFAIDLPEATKATLGSFIGALKKKSRTNAIRWSRPENLHITLQFLAEVKSEHIPQLLANVRKQLASAPQKSTLGFGEVHLFPNPFRPRVIVLDLLPQDHLATLSKLIGSGIQEAAYTIENRPFRGHLTLGRIKQPQNLDLKFLDESSPPEVAAIDVSAVVLFRSEPQPEGSTYTVIERISL